MFLWRLLTQHFLLRTSLVATVVMGVGQTTPSAASATGRGLGACPLLKAWREKYASNVQGEKIKKYLLSTGLFTFML